ncbi:MAG: hypothetical protein JWP01_2110 [Myxococcales bacterium]|nr:hypothetical protein [Myxococcales bacterium]
MIVFSNQRLGPAAEVLVSSDVAAAMLRSTAEAARPLAEGRWEYECVLWLEDRSRRVGAEGEAGLDVGEIAWTPDHFERQKSFVTAAIQRAALGSEHARALSLWARQVGAHPRESVVVGRRWRWAVEASSI